MSIQGAVMSDENREFTDFPFTRKRRAKHLNDHLDRVQSFVEEADSIVEDLVYDGSLGRIRLSFSEADAVRRALDDDETADADPQGFLMAEALAVCLKISEDVNDYQTAALVDEQLEGRIRSVLELDLITGESIVGDFAEPIDGAFAAGHREEAIRLGELRLIIRQHMAHVRRTLAGQQSTGETAGDPDTAGSALPSIEPQPDADVEQPDQLEESRKRYNKLKRNRIRENLERTKMRRILRLVIALGAAVLVGAAGFAIQMLPAFSVQGPVELTIDDFEGVPGISTVLAKPPSLFVTVYAEHWDSVDRASRLRIVNRLGSILLKSDYNGAVLTDPAGKLVGEWIRGDGSYVYPLP